MPAALGGASFILAMAIDGRGYLKVALLALGFLLPSTSFVLGPAMVSEVAPTRQRGTALLVTYSAITVAGFISPAVMGYALQSASQDVVASYANAFHMTAGVLIVDGFGGFLLLDPDASRRRLASAQSDSGVAAGLAVGAERYEWRDRHVRNVVARKFEGRQCIYHQTRHVADRDCPQSRLPHSVWSTIMVGREGGRSISRKIENPATQQT
jgi:MFS family permease